MRGWKEGEGSGRLMEKGARRGIKFLKTTAPRGLRGPVGFGRRRKKRMSQQIRAAVNERVMKLCRWCRRGGKSIMNEG